MNAHVLSVHIQNLGVGWEKEQRQDSYPIPSHKPLLSLNAWLKYHLNFFFKVFCLSQARLLLLCSETPVYFLCIYHFLSTKIHYQNII